MGDGDGGVRRVPVCSPTITSEVCSIKSTALITHANGDKTGVGLSIGWPVLICFLVKFICSLFLCLTLAFFRKSIN